MELIKLLPDYYEQNRTMKDLQKILSDATDDLEVQLSDTVSECFAVTASSMLERYENILFLKVKSEESDEYRRERIIAKVSGFGVTTKEMMADVASRYSNGEVQVIEDNANSQFAIKFDRIGITGVPANLSDLKMAIEEIKPAHLEYKFVLQYEQNNRIYVSHAVREFKKLTLSDYCTEEEPASDLVWYVDSDETLLLTSDGSVITV